MTVDEIDKYREKIDTQLKEKVGEIETNMSIIIIGSLGFFLTINEKFIGLKAAERKGLMFVSVVCLFLAFVLFLWGKHLTTQYDRRLIDFLDKDMQPESEESDQALLHQWSRFDGNLTLNRNGMYWAVGLGILFQLIFFFYNLRKPDHPEPETSATKITIVIRDSTFQLSSDSAFNGSIIHR